MTVSDIDQVSVSAIADGDLGSHSRATVKVVDATEIDAADNTFDLAVSALTFHHLPPRLAVKVIAEGTRVATRLMIIEVPLRHRFISFGWR
jgi:ubiquinone/menaquinone biosynthesis C-methylase UbiE